MRSLHAHAIALVAALLAPFVLAGCPRGMGSAGAAPDAAAAPSEPVNAKDITRYPYEKKLKDVSATLLKDGVARKSPPDGPPITTLSKGTVVRQTAQTSDAYLVTFDDPSSGASGARKVGWVGENAFSDAPAPAAGGGGGGSPRGNTGGSSGANASSSGGGGSSGTPATPSGTTIFTQPVNGQCPSGFAKSNVGCHRKCSGDGECPSGVKCKAGMLGSTKICTTG